MSSSDEPETTQYHPLVLVVLVIGSLSLVLGAVGEFSGLFNRPAYELQTALEAQLGSGSVFATISPAFSYAYLALMAYGTSFTFLSITGLWRAVLFWCVVMLLTCSLVLVLSLYQIWFSPLPSLLAIVWSGAGSFYHLSHVSKPPKKPEAKPEPDFLSSAVDVDDEWEEFRQRK